MDGQESDATSENCIIFTPAGSFKVRCSLHDALRRLAAEEWPTFALADGHEQIVLRSGEVAAIQSVRPSRGPLGFTR